VEFGIRSEDADIVQVLVAVGWWCVVVFAEHVASPGDAGVAEPGRGGIVVTEYRRTTIAPWGSSYISTAWWSCESAASVLCKRGGLKVFAVLWMCRVAAEGL